MNKKIASEIAIGIILIVALIIGGFIWLDGKKKESQTQLKITNPPVQLQTQPATENKEESEQIEMSTENNENEEDPEQVKIITGKSIRIEITNGKKYCEDASYPDIGYQKILKAVYPNGTEKVLYSTSKTRQSESDCLFSEGICCLKLSPSEKYLIFSKTGWEWSKPYMLNIDTGKYVFGDEAEIKDIYIIREIKWSSDNNNFAIISDVNEMGGAGEMGIYVSVYNNPDKIKKIWSAQNYLLSDISSVNFIGNNKLRIEIEQSNKENSPKTSINYEYDFKQDKLAIAN